MDWTVTIRWGWNNMKNRIIGFLTALALIMSASPVFASIDDTMSTTEPVITITGDADSFQKVTLLLLDNKELTTADKLYDDKSVVEEYKKIISTSTATTAHISYYGQAAADKNGIYSHDIPLNPSIEVGVYTIWASTGDSCIVIYSSATYKQSLVAKLQAEAEKGLNYLTKAIENEVSYVLGLKGKDNYNSISDKTNVSTIVNQEIMSITPDNLDSVSELTTLLSNSIDIQRISEGKIENFDDAYELLLTDTEVASYVSNITETGKKAAVSNIQGKTFDSRAKFDKLFKNELALQLINNNTNATSENLLKAFESCNSILKLDVSKFNQLSHSDKAYAIKKLSDKNPKTIDDADKELTSIVKGLLPDTTSRPSTSGIGAGAGGATVKGPGIATETVIPSANNTAGFTDMTGYEWAVESVKSLVELGIISGYGDSTFKPQNSITRAEFVKLVTMAFYKDNLVETSSVFGDVPDDMWCSKYIMTAYENSIVSGVGNGSFNPDGIISRQDMAVILCNAAKKYNLISTAERNLFNDDASISEYAKEAVYVLRDIGIVNGIGNNEYNPLVGADRASAAKMLDMFIKYVEAGHIN